ncbi:hypothetical protein H0W91_01510 [Patescibacteria group bacterium]|nr:hypothetical protein [Patescibacteria group bacterium]
MQITPHNGQIVEKIMRDKQGRLVRAKFFIYESAGRLKARLIDFTYSVELVSLAAAQALLLFYNKIKSKLANLFAKQELAFVPINTDNDIDHSGTKPRAPTL